MGQLNNTYESCIRPAKENHDPLWAQMLSKERALPSHEINQAIVDGSADIGIDCDKGNFPETLVHKSLRSVAACLIASPFIDPKETDFITPHQRKPFAIIGNEPKANYQTALTEYLDAKDIVLRPFMKFQSIEAV